MTELESEARQGSRYGPIFFAIKEFRSKGKCCVTGKLNHAENNKYNANMFHSFWPIPAIHLRSEPTFVFNKKQTANIIVCCCETFLAD